MTGADALEYEADRRLLRDYYLSRRIAAFPSTDRALKALANVVKYREGLKG